MPLTPLEQAETQAALEAMAASDCWFMAAVRIVNGRMICHVSTDSFPFEAVAPALREIYLAMEKRKVKKLPSGVIVGTGIPAELPIEARMAVERKLAEKPAC